MFSVNNHLKNFTITLGIETLNIFLLDTILFQRDDMRREVGEGFRIGNSCTPVADSCQCMPKPIHCCKVNIVKIKIKKKRTDSNVLFLMAE